MRNLLAALLFVCTPVVVLSADMDRREPSGSNVILGQVAVDKEAAPSRNAPSATAATMKPETAQFLRSIGIDPESTEIALIYSEGPAATSYQGDPKVYSLDTLAAEKAKNGIAGFVATRNFIRQLKQNFAGTPIPAAGYDGLYLTVEERKLALKKLFG